jgi:hypothetical protein
MTRGTAKMTDSSGKNTAKTAEKQRGRPFQKGESGNPNGRKEGSRNKATLIAQALLDGEAEALTRKVIDQALEGDTVCLRVCLERLVPPRKDAPVNISLPKVASACDLPKATGVLLQAVAKGKLTPGEAHTLASILEAHRKTLEIADLESRIAALEERTKK